MQDVDPKWVPCGGKWISRTKLTELKKVGEEQLLKLYTMKSNLSATIDIWTDRRMRAYMGITVHWMDKTHFEMDMACLDVFRIKGSHTAVNILEHVDNCFIRYGIKCKVTRIVRTLQQT